VRGFRALCRAGAAAAVALVVIGGAAVPALASDVGDNLRAQRWVESQIVKITKSHRLRAPILRRAVLVAGREAAGRPGRPTLSAVRDASMAQVSLDRVTRRRLSALDVQRQQLEAWLYSWGVFRVCPVDAPHYIHNDFGEIVHVEGVEPHVHMGNDIEAPTWTPIRAPFDGYAWGSYSPLGGYQARVRGDRGYVFNAHLIAYGRLGWVSAGTIIGYVGATGDSTAPHDHFEWHPWNGGAVDPHYLLTLSCD
jgi:murein DD-endopeptidase MepM/ murein hydrolase activator NlpD